MDEISFKSNEFLCKDDKNFYEIIIEKVNLLIKVYEDPRLTLMIKNIPNKYNSKLLREKIDLNFLKKYVFFYLPIDFTVFIYIKR